MVKIRVQNFQSIADATIEVDGFTVITGSNNIGKSALMRAVAAAFQNARGTSFIRHGAAKTSVDIDFGDGRTLHWEKGRGKGTRPAYSVDGGKPINPGQGVPPEVEALGIRPVQAGGREIWPQFAPQFTGQVFLIDQPGSVLAEAVADVDRVGQLNQALRDAESDRRSASAELKIRQADEEKAAADLVLYDGLDEAAKEVDGIDEEARQAHRLGKALAGTIELRDRLAAARAVVESLAGIGKVDIPDAQVTVAVADRNSLGELRALKARIESARGKARTFEAADVAADLDSAVAEKTRAALAVIRGLADRHGGVAAKIKSLEEALELADSESRESAEEASSLLAELGECPVCGAATGGR